MSQPLTPEEKKILLNLAREALECAVHEKKLPPLDQSTLTPALREQGASFVTLTIFGSLRGCIGALEPYQPLVDDVREHAISAALQDYRFSPVTEGELNKIIPSGITYVDENTVQVNFTIAYAGYATVV